jgi:threonine dehydratase
MDLPAIREAQEFLRRYIPVSRLVRAPWISNLSRSSVFLKLESELPTGSFKPRGALYALSVNLKRRNVREVVASSTGNHGAAVAYAAKLLGVPATIFLPESPNPIKRARIAELGAKIVERGRDIVAAFQHASEYSKSAEIYLLNDATDPDLPAATATIGCEILEQLQETEAIYVPIGDTALIRGVGAAVRELSPKVKIIGIQAERAPAYFLSWKDGRVVNTNTCATIADGLATRTPDPDNVRAIRELVDDIRLVREDQMRDAIRQLLLQEHVVAEPAGAAATAALLQEEVGNASNIVLLVSGSNIALDVLRKAVCEETSA